MKRRSAPCHPPDCTTIRVCTLPRRTRAQEYRTCTSPSFRPHPFGAAHADRIGRDRGRCRCRCRSRSCRHSAENKMRLTGSASGQISITNLSRPRHSANPEATARKLLEIANGGAVVQGGRIHIEKINGLSCSALAAQDCKVAAYGLFARLRRSHLCRNACNQGGSPHMTRRFQFQP